MGFLNSIFGSSKKPTPTKNTPIKKFVIREENNIYVKLFIVSNISKIPATGMNVRDNVFGKSYAGYEASDELYNFSQKSKFISGDMFMELIRILQHRAHKVTYYIDENHEGYLISDDGSTQKVFGWQKYDKSTQETIIQLFKDADYSVIRYFSTNYD